MNRTHVLALLPLFVGLAHSFSWDIVVGVEKRLEFYYNGTLNHSEEIPSANYITSVTYDPAQGRVLFADRNTDTSIVSSFDLSTRIIQRIVTRITKDDRILGLAYDPVTQLLFWMEGNFKIYSLSLKPASSNNAVDGTLFVKLNGVGGDIAVDSCRGFIYWTTDHEIERAAFDGSKREVLLNGGVYWRGSFAIDQQKEIMYWIEEVEQNQYSLESTDLTGKNRRTFNFIGKEHGSSGLTVSKDFIYWRSYHRKTILRLPKNQQNDAGPVVYADSSTTCWRCQLTAANYKIEEQTLGIKNCEALNNLIHTSSDSKVSEECVGSTCHNYCFQGNCSVSAEGQPKCSCEAGYSGERCEVNVCYEHCLNGGVCSLNEEDEPVCLCTAGYEGERCDVATSLTGDHAEYATQQILRDLRKEAKKIIKEELKHALLFLSDKIDEYETKI